MHQNRYNQVANFLLGAAIGATIGLIVGLLFAPRSGSKSRDSLRNYGLRANSKAVHERDSFSERIRSATDEWLAKLRATANDMVVKGYISPEEARSQISGLLKKVRG